MSLFSRPRAAVLKRAQSTSLSDNSHSSESGASHRSSDTSWATHFPTGPSALSPLPKGAGAPKVNPPSLQSDVPIMSPNARKSRVLRKSSPPASDATAEQSKDRVRRWVSFRTPSRGPSRSPARVRINLDDDPPFVPGAPGMTRHVSLSPQPKSSSLPAPSSYRQPRRPRSPARPRSSTMYASESGSHPPDVLDRLRSELARIGEDRPKSSSGRHMGRGRPNKNLVDRNKPLPTPPGLAHGSSNPPPASHPEPTSIGVTGTPIRFRHSSYAAASKEEEAESRFGHFSSGPGTSMSGRAYSEYAYTPRASWSDLGHGSGCVTPVWDDGRSEAHYQSSEPHYQSREPFPSPYSARPPSVLYADTNLAPSARSTLMFAPRARSAPLYSHSTPHFGQEPAAPSPRLSIGKRIKRTLSFSFSRASSETGHTRASEFGVRDHPQPRPDPPQPVHTHSYSDHGHGSMHFQHVSTSPTFMPWSQQHFEDYPYEEPLQKPRKLKKRSPSLSSSVALKEGSTSTPGLVEPQFTTPPHARPEPNSTRTRSRSSPPRHVKEGTTSPPVPPLPTAVSPMSPLLVPEPQTPSPAAPVRKLTKRVTKRMKTDSVVDGMDVTLPPVRAVSPIDINSITPSFSQASRSHSAPNLGPLAPAFQHHPGTEVQPSHYLSFLTESPPTSPVSPHGPDEIGHHQEASTSDRPSFLRSQSNRRWTLAVSEVPDEQLVEELEQLRSVGWGLGFQGEFIRVKAAADGGEGERRGDKDAPWGTVDDAGWLVARRALMVCREIVRTERNYRAGLVSLQHGKTRKTPPPLLLQYLPALISTSQDFSARLDEDPSAWGVSAAFLGMEDALEVALVAWSGVVGEFFTTNKSKQRKHWSTGYVEKEKKEKEKEKKVVTGAPILPLVGSRDDAYASASTSVQSKSAPSTWRKSMPALSQLLTSTNDIPPTETRKPQHSTGSQGSAKTPTVQDLAIQPTQRVMRYVLLYKDLLNSTPIASPARPLVERALDGATRIAQRCNRAQDNSAFLT